MKDTHISSVLRRTATIAMRGHRGDKSDAPVQLRAYTVLAAADEIRRLNTEVVTLRKIVDGIKQRRKHPSPPAPGAAT